MKPIPIVCTLAVVGALAGCATSATPGYDAAFGESVRQARGMQLLNPDGARNPDPVAGIDGRAGRSGIERYQESFRTPPPTFEILNIGGSALGGGGGQ